MENLPVYISIAFVCITFLTVYIFYRAAHRSQTTLLILLSWLLLQGIISGLGFYTVTESFPPRFIFAVLPTLLVIIFLFSNKKGRQYIDTLDIKTLTILHVVSIPVELVLFSLFVYKTIPQLMTFEGRNWDILSGLTAPVVYYLVFVKNIFKKKILLIWNLICLGLLINIVSNAILSLPYSFQQFAFDQPNIGILYFPFVWLPACVVPLVLFSHLVTLRKLLQNT